MSRVEFDWCYVKAVGKMRTESGLVDEAFLASEIINLDVLVWIDLTSASLYLHCALVDSYYIHPLR